MTLDNLLVDERAGIQAVQVCRGEVKRDNPYSQWNLCDYVGDDALRVLDARLAFCALMDIDLDRLVMPRQRHTARVAVVDSDYWEADIERQGVLLDGVDALVTALPGVCIGVNTADCVSIVLADTRAGVIGAAHAGWRGTVAHIARHTVEAMVRLGAEPHRVVAAMGASICARCFEVGDEVPQAFEKAGFDLNQIMHRSDVTGRAHINLHLANRWVLEQAGLRTDLITMPRYCSRCDSDRYFSARRLGIDSGRTFTGIIRR